MSKRSRVKAPDTYALGIECSNPSSGASDAVALALLGGDAPVRVGSSPMLGSGRGSDALVETIDQLTREHGVRPSQIRRVCVSLGPGGYTALRVSVTAAKSIAYALGCELVGVPTHEALAPTLDAGGLPCMTLLASKGSSAHACVHKQGSSPQILGVVEAPVLRSHAPRTLVCDSHAPEAFLGLAAELGIEVRPVRFDPFACVIAAEPIKPCDPMGLGVVYAREPDAVTQWNLRHGEDD